MFHAKLKISLANEVKWPDAKKWVVIQSWLSRSSANLSKLHIFFISTYKYTYFYKLNVPMKLFARHYLLMQFTVLYLFSFRFNSIWKNFCLLLIAHKLCITIKNHVALMKNIFNLHFTFTRWVKRIISFSFT